MQLFEELQRRNVFRVTIGYVISAWLLAQVADLVLENIGAPDWVMQSILLVLALALPVVVFFAWAFEVTPEGIKRESEVDRSQSITHVTGKKLDRAIIAVLVLALAYFIWESRFAPGQGGETAGLPTSAAESSQPAPPGDTPDQGRPESALSIAVLPFENRSNREEDQFFTDGIHDDLLTKIAKIGSMKVISRTSVMEYRGTTKKIPEIATELGVAHILEGGIQRAGNQVRINVQLIEASTDEHLWAETFDRELTAENLFAIQSEISAQVAEALQAALTPEEQQRINAMPTDNLEAYDAYHRGKMLMATRRVADLREAVVEFQRAVELDPGFALAWVGVVDSNTLLKGYDNTQTYDTIEMRLEAVRKALEIDPFLGEAHISKATLHQELDEDAEAEAAFKKGIELSPNYATAYMWYSGSMRFDMLKSRERLDLLLKAVELDPRSMIIGTSLAGEYFYQGMYSRGVQQARKLIAMDPQFPNAYHLLVDHYMLAAVDFAEALANAEKLEEIDPENLDALRHQIEIFTEIGEYAVARAINQKIIDLNPESIFAAWTDLLISTHRGNRAGFGETSKWFLDHAGEDLHLAQRVVAELSLALGDVERARELHLQRHPEWRDEAQWEHQVRTEPTGACEMSWIFLHSGDRELGEALLEIALDFHETRLPAAIEHADNHQPDICLLAAGEHEKALESLETQLAHGHYYQWGFWLRAPIYDPIRDDPRFVALVAEHERLVAEQRDAVMAERSGSL